MIRAIWKFPFPIEEEFVLEMPRYPRILHVQMQDGQPCLWAFVEVDAPKVKYVFSLRGTGHSCDGIEPNEFISTFFATPDGSLVFHLFYHGPQ